MRGRRTSLFTALPSSGGRVASGMGTGPRVTSTTVVAGSAEDLAAILPNGRALPIPNRDHMLAVGDKVYKEAVLKFLQERR